MIRSKTKRFAYTPHIFSCERWMEDPEKVIYPSLKDREKGAILYKVLADISSFVMLPKLTRETCPVTLWI